MTDKIELSKIHQININKIIPYEKNPRKNNEAVDPVAESIKEFGFKVPIVVDKNNVIITGHTRYKAAKKLKMKTVPCIVADDLTEEQAKAFRLADNKVGEIAEWDTDLLHMELDDILNIDMEAFGFDLDIDEESAEVVEDDFEAELPAEPKAKLGDIYQLGRHRLMCGDSTSVTDVDKLLDGERADMIFTDPPYNVAFNGRSGNFDVIKNDNLTDDEFADFIDATISIIKYINAPIYYIWCNWNFYGILQGKLDYKSCIVWAKNVFGMGKGYRHQHEFCLFNGKIDENIKNETDLWQIKKDHTYVHPTQKPVELSYRAIGNHSGVQTVLDLFGGSGSTLIGCEQRNVRCYMMELDPKYIDVIVGRWEKLTGEKAVLLNGDN
jgi:site-specific DNA-methyltransferase (adenine-specific)